MTPTLLLKTQKFGYLMNLHFKLIFKQIN